jgi:hypothetical protein
MVRQLFAVMLLAGATLLLNGCAATTTTGTGVQPFPYPPYQEAYPGCGALGTCPGGNRAPYPMQGTIN